MMGFEDNLATKAKPLMAMRVSSGHKRSSSESDKLKDYSAISPETGYHPKATDMERLKDCNEFPHNLESSVKSQEIDHLEKRLQDQFVVRNAVEEALGRRFSVHDTLDDKSMPKPAKDLIKEIAVLEWEVAHLEQYLLTLYRKAFKEQILCPAKDGRFVSPPVTQKGACPETNGLTKTLKGDRSVSHSSRLPARHDSLANPPKENSSMMNDMLLDSGIHRSHSTLDQRSAYEIRYSPPAAKGMWSFHSQPMSSLEYAPDSSSSMTSLAEHLGTGVANHVPEAPNRVSEDMIRCMSAIYCKVSDPPIIRQCLSNSPNTPLSMETVFSPQDQFDIWSPCHRKESSFDAHLDNPFHIDGLKEFSGPYSTMAEVPWICRDKQRLNAIDDMLQHYKSLVRQLETVDPRKLKHKEKLAFWINIHNALAMHALLVYGIPQNNVKRISMILKAAYNVGGHTISADTIQGSILGCRMPRPVQWLRVLFSPRTKFKSGDSQQSYAIEHPEPLTHFALCSGSHSDPAIRMYTPNKVIQDLEVAKEEYIRATLGVRKEQKLLLPKIVESFAKDSGLSSPSLVEMIQQSIPETLRKSLRPFEGKSRKSIEWAPHNFTFRYLISNELVK